MAATSGLQNSSYYIRKAEDQWNTNFWYFVPQRAETENNIIFEFETILFSRVRARTVR